MISGTSETIHIIGCGDIGRRVAEKWLQTGGKAEGMVLNEASVERLQASGIKAIQGDLDAPRDLYSDPETHPAHKAVFYFAPPSKYGLIDLRLRGWLDALCDARPAKIVLISTTGVYGDAGGEWITETMPTTPVADRARRRLDTETAMRDWCNDNDVPFVILRVPGIYGPGKLPQARLEKGLPVLNEQEAGFTNRIHADDLATVCLAAMQHGRPGEVYNVSDGQPGTMTDYFNKVADHLGLPRPPQVSLVEAETQVSAGMLSYLKESRRIDNSKMLKELKVKLRYPDLATGLKGS